MLTEPVQTGLLPMWVAAGDNSGGTNNGSIMYSYDGISWSFSVGANAFNATCRGTGIAYGTSSGSN